MSDQPRKRGKSSSTLTWGKWLRGRKHTVPGQVHARKPREPDQRMAHQSHPAALWRAAEEGDPDFAVSKPLAVVHHGIPGGLAASGLEVVEVDEVGAERGVCRDDPAEADLEQGRERRTEMPIELYA